MGKRVYTKADRANAIALVLGGKPQAQVARQLGISEYSISTWVRGVSKARALAKPPTLPKPPRLETDEQLAAVPAALVPLMDWPNTHTFHGRDIALKPARVPARFVPAHIEAVIGSAAALCADSIGANKR